MSSTTPAVVEKHLDAVKCWEDGKIALASSNLTGRYWSGSIWCFPAAEDAPNIEKCVAGVETECGIADILTAPNKNVVVGMDSGAINLYHLEEGSPPIFVSPACSHEHDDLVTSLSMNPDKSKFASSSFDKSVKVWDLRTVTTVATYRPAHASVVWQVSFSTTDPNIMLSCGQDGVLLLLDMRLPKPATILSSAPLKDKPTAVAWQPQSNTTFASGDEGGHIVVRDIRKAETAVHYKGHDRSIFRLAFSVTCPSLLASCADESKVFVTDISKDSPKTVYMNDAHEDFVRGLTWNPDNALVTCGYDKKVIKHTIPSPEMDVLLTNGI